MVSLQEHSITAVHIILFPTETIDRYAKIIAW